MFAYLASIDSELIVDCELRHFRLISLKFSPFSVAGGIDPLEIGASKWGGVINVTLSNSGRGRGVSQRQLIAVNTRTFTDQFLWFSSNRRIVAQQWAITGW